MQEISAMQQLIDILKEAIIKTKSEFKGNPSDVSPLESNINTIIGGAELLMKVERKQIEDAVNYTLEMYDTPYELNGSEYYEITFKKDDATT